MEGFNKNLKFGFKISLLIDLIVLFLWFGFVFTDLLLFNYLMVVLSIIHITLIYMVFYFLKKNKIDYSVPKEYKLILMVGTVIGLTMVIIDIFINWENALSLGLMLFNSILFLSYPIKRYIVHE